MPETTAPSPARCTAVVGLQWGDEGKGKVTDLLAARHDIIARYNGGANAGHSVVVGGARYALHLVPSGILYPGKLAVIGNGVVIDPDKLVEELTGLEARGVDTSGLIVSDRAHVVLPYHKLEDARREEILTRASESGAEIGTTKRGIGPAYAEKVQRSCALRVRDLLDEPALRERVTRAWAFRVEWLEALAEQDPSIRPDAVVERLSGLGRTLAPRVCDTVYRLHDEMSAGRSVLFEGANATLLDVDHGTYPYVTSSSTCALGVGAGSGVPPQRINSIIGVAKAYSTRVGRGPMPTELDGDVAHRIRERGREYGTTTGRPRRVGWIDLVALRYAVMINGVTEVALTLIDALSGMSELNICTAYDIDGERTDRFIPDGATLAAARPVLEHAEAWREEIGDVRARNELPPAARRYVDRIEQFIGAPIRMIGVGPGREQTITS